MKQFVICRAWIAMTARTWIVDFSRRSQPLQMMVNPLNVQTLWLNQMMIQWSQEASLPCLFLQHYFWWIWSNTNTPLEVCISHIPLYPWISNLQCKLLHSMYFWTYKKWSFRLYLVHHQLTYKNKQVWRNSILRLCKAISKRMEARRCKCHSLDVFLDNTLSLCKFAEKEK